MDSFIERVVTSYDAAADKRAARVASGDATWSVDWTFLGYGMCLCMYVWWACFVYNKV